MVCCCEDGVGAKKSDFSQKTMSPVDLTKFISGDVGLSKNHYEHLSQKCTDKLSD